MANKAPTSIVLSSDTNPGETGNPGITQTTTVRRTVTRVCEVITDLSFSEPAKVLAPLVHQASGGVLDFRIVTGDIIVVVKKWTFMAAGQKAWLDIRGKLKNGTSHTIRVMAGKAITANDVANGLSRTVSRTALEKFPDYAQLTIIFMTAVDECCEDGAKVVFPELKLVLRRPYRDLENFSSQTLGHWTIGPGAPDSRDLTIQRLDFGPDGKPGYFVRNYTYTEASVGPILQRVFDNLVKGDAYKFSVDVRRYSIQYKTPKLSLRQDSVDKTPVLELVDLNWHVLSFTFVAGAAPVLLSLYSHEMSGQGNDWYMGNFLVESAPAAP